MKFKITLLIIFFIFLNYFFISLKTHSQIYNHHQDLPKNQVALLLGTSPYTKQGKLNPYFTSRIHDAITLYQNQKINFIIVSGDNRTHSYNEPKYMRQALISQGVPPDKIIEDYAGFKTLDSVIRAKKIFGQNRLTIISQKFHLERALFIANSQQITAVGFTTASHSLALSRNLPLLLREIFSRIKASFELLINKQPKFLGEPIQIQ